MNTRNTQSDYESSKNLRAVAIAERILMAAAHPFRFKLIAQLKGQQTYTAEQLAWNCKMPLERTTQHLRILVKHELVDQFVKPAGNCYSLNHSSYRRIIDNASLFSDFVDFE